MTCMKPALFISSMYDMPPYSSESYLNKSLYPSVTPSSSIIKENPSSFKTFSLLQYLSNFLLRNSFSVKQEKILSTNSTLKLDVFKSMCQLKSTPCKIYYSQNHYTYQQFELQLPGIWQLSCHSAAQILLQLLLIISGSPQQNHFQVAVF